MSDEHYRIGELAQAAGVTVRALHHYDRLGLLVPSERTPGGHRLYTPADVQRLYRLLALRELGLPLGEIGAVLDADDALTGTVRRHLSHVERRLQQLEALRQRLTWLLAALDGSAQPTTASLEAMEAMSMFEKYYTPEQLAQLERRREEFGDERIKAVEREWAELYASLREHRERGTDPADEAVQALGRRAGELVEMFTGGDPGIRASLQRMYEQEGPQRASRGMADPEDQAYLAAIRAARS
jgi:MerR family transcriptional regulator, thiopeptide resistance regulator